MRLRAWSRQGGFALVVVLAFMALLMVVSIAYLSRSASDRPVAHSSFNQSKADQLAASAMDNIIGDVRQEIIAGSSPSPAPTFGPSPTASPLRLYVPMVTANVVPMRNPTATPGTTPAIPNLIRRSVRSEPANWPDPATGPARGSRASAVNSLVDVSAN